MDKFSTPLAYSTSGSLVVFGMALNDIALLVGVIATIITTIVNWYYKAKDDKRKEQNSRFGISPLD